MNIGILVFAYNRSQHLKKVLDGLRENSGVSKLYIFQDGLKCEEHQNEWEKTKQIIRETNWCEVIYNLSPYNKGLAVSVVDGINAGFEENDAVVVLEDDCVPHPLFMEYMTGCLKKYQDDKRVFSVNGYSWNADVEPNGTDAYFIGRTSSWGWATWKDRWLLYQQDYKIIGRIRKDLYKSRQFDIWGQDLEDHLLGNIYGRCDSWAVFWALKCIEQGGFCPTPYYSLIDNIGFDGTGVHCGTADINTKIRARTDREKIVLPETVEFPIRYEIVYADWFKRILPEVKLNCYNKILFQWNTILHKGISLTNYFEKRNITSIAIWGRGDLCKALLSELEGKIEVKCIIESNPINAQFENISVVKPSDVPSEVQAIVVIPIYDIDSIQKIYKEDNEGKLVGIDKILKNICEDYNNII